MTTLSLSQAMTAFLQALEQDGRASRTIASYRRDLQQLLRFLTDARQVCPVDTITTDRLAAALADPHWTTKPDGQPRAPATLARQVAAVRAFFRWCCQVGLLSANPATGLSIPRVIVRPAPGVLTDGDVTRLRATLAAASGWGVRRDQVLLECFLSVGLQLHEVHALTVDNLDLAANRVHVGAAEKYLNRELRAALAAYLPWRHARSDATTRALFLSQRGARLSRRSIADRIERWMKRAGLPAGLTPKNLRATFAVRLYRAQPSLRLVQQALGYKDIRTTSVYAVLMEDDLATAMEGL